MTGSFFSRHGRALRGLVLCTAIASLTLACAEEPATDEGEAFDFFAPNAKLDGLYTPCEGMLDPLRVGRGEGKLGAEISGLVASTQQPGVFWAINDRGNDPELHALDRTGERLATFSVAGATNIDWEDIAMGTGPDGEPAVYIADIGDNDRERDEIVLYRLAEPTLTAGVTSASGSLGAESIPLRYPDGAHDAESLFVDPVDGRLWIVTRRRKGEDAARLFWTPPSDAPEFTGELTEHRVDHELFETRITGADATERGLLLLANDDAALVWRRRDGESIESLLERRPCVGASTDGNVGAVAIDPFTGGWTLVPEGDEPDIVQLGLDPACPTTGDPVKVGKVESEAVVEASGLVASEANPGHLWTHNDGPDPRIFLVDDTGEVRAILGFDTEVVDVEDIALGPGPDPSVAYLYLADIGDNALDRSEVTIYRLPEPALELGSGVTEFELVGAEAFTFEYDDGDAHDAESLMVDPLTGDLLVLTKRNGDDARTRVFTAYAPLERSDETLHEVFDERRAIGLDGRIVAGDISRDGRWLLLAVKDDGIYLFPRTGLEPMWHPLQLGSCWGPDAKGQIEAVGFDPSGDGYWMLAEGSSPDLVRVSW